MTEACTRTLARAAGESFLHILGRFKEFRADSNARKPTVLDYIYLFDKMMGYYDIRTSVDSLRGKPQRDKLDDAVEANMVTANLHSVLRGCRRKWHGYGRINANWAYRCHSTHHRGPNSYVADDLFHQNRYIFKSTATCLGCCYREWSHEGIIFGEENTEGVLEDHKSAVAQILH